MESKPMTPAWWGTKARELFARGIEGGAVVGRVGDDGHKEVVFAATSPRNALDLVMMTVAVYIKGQMDAGVLTEDYARRSCQAIGEAVFRHAYDLSQKLEDA